jgi:hypothetical protein
VPPLPLIMPLILPLLLKTKVSLPLPPEMFLMLLNVKVLGKRLLRLPSSVPCDVPGGVLVQAN